MSFPSSTAFRSFLAIIGYNAYLSVFHNPSAALHATDTISSTTTASTTPQTFLTAKGLYKPNTAIYKSYDPDAISLHNFLQCYIALHMAVLYTWPFWRIVEDGFEFRRFPRNLVVSWSLAFFVYVGFLIIEKHYNLA
jgi:hypothetical protein